MRLVIQINKFDWQMPNPIPLPIPGILDGISNIWFYLAALLAGILLSIINGKKNVPNEVHAELTTVGINDRVYWAIFDTNDTTGYWLKRLYFFVDHVTYKEIIINNIKYLAVVSTESVPMQEHLHRVRMFMAGHNANTDPRIPFRARVDFRAPQFLTWIFLRLCYNVKLRISREPLIIYAQPNIFKRFMKMSGSVPLICIVNDPVH